MTYDLAHIKSRLDLRHVAHDLHLKPKRFASAFLAHVRFHCPSPRHPNGDTKGDLSVACDHFTCHSANCGAKGDVFDLLALVHDLERDAHFGQLVADAAHRAGVDLPTSSGLIPPRSSLPAPPSLPRAKGPHATPRACEVRRRILGEIQAILEPYPLSPQALAWCKTRGLDPDVVHREGGRDWSSAQGELLALLGSYSKAELMAAGLFRQSSGGANWVPPLGGGLTQKHMTSRALAIPVRDAQGDMLSYRFRLLGPGRKRGLKELPAYGSVGPKGMGLGAHALGEEIHTLLVCEGVPDYLAAREAVGQMPGVGVWASCAVGGLATQLPLLLCQLRQNVRVHLLIHHDEGGQGGGSRPLARLPLWQALCKREDLDGVDLRVWHVEGKRDLCDLHACGELQGHLDAMLMPGGSFRFADRTPEFEAMRQAFLAQPAPLPSLLTPTRAHPQAPPCQGEALELPALREALTERLRRVITQGGMHAVCAPPGSGKSYAARRAILEAWERGERIKVVVPTNRLAEEVVRDLIAQAGAYFGDPVRRLEFGQSVEFAPKRTPTTCVRLAEVHEANRVVHQGGKEVCRRCELHPGNQGDGGKSECGFFGRVRGFGRGRILVTTHELELLTTPQGRGERACTRIDWAQIAGLLAQAARCVPWVTQTQGGLSLGVKEDPHGTPLPPLRGPLGHEAWEDALGADPRPLDGAAQEAMLAWFGGHLEGETPATREAIFEAYTSSGPDAWLWDLMVIDELPLGAMRQVVSATLEDLNLWRTSGDLSVADDAAWRRVCDAFASEEVLADAHLQARLGTLGLSVRQGVSQTGMEQLGEALAHDGPERLRRLGGAPDHRALLALEGARARAFVDARVEGGRVYLAHLRRFDTRQARCLLYLDATAHPGTICAMFGGAMTRHGFEAKMPQGLRVTQMPWSATKNLVDAGGVMRQELDSKRLAACVAAFDSEGTRWMMHRSWEGVLGQEVGERGSYYGSARARGVNEWEGAHTIVAGAHYVPKAELESCARSLRWMAQDQGADVSQIDWGAAASWELTTAPIIQALWRIRPLSATATHPKHIVLLDVREVPGLMPTEVVEVEALMVRTTGEVWGKAGWREVVRGLMTRSQGMFLPALVAQNLSQTPFTPEPPSSSLGDLGGYASLPLTHWQTLANELRGHIQAHWGGWEAMAKDLGLEYRRLRTSHPGMPWVVLWDKEVPFDLGEVCRRCEERGLDWVEWEGKRIHVGPLWYLDALPHLEEPPTSATLATFFECTPRTICRRLASSGHTLLDVRTAWEGYQEGNEPEASPGLAWAGRELVRAMESRREMESMESRREMGQAHRVWWERLAHEMGLSVAATRDWCRLLGQRRWGEPGAKREARARERAWCARE